MSSEIFSVFCFWQMRFTIRKEHLGNNKPTWALFALKYFCQTGSFQHMAFVIAKNILPKWKWIMQTFPYVEMSLFYLTSKVHHQPFLINWELSQRMGRGFQNPAVGATVQIMTPLKLWPQWDVRNSRGSSLPAETVRFSNIRLQGRTLTSFQRNRDSYSVKTVTNKKTITDRKKRIMENWQH